MCSNFSPLGIPYVIVAFPGHHASFHIYSKTCIKRPLSKTPKIGFQDQLSLNAGQTYCRMLHSAILSIFIKLPFVIKISSFCTFLSGRFTVCLSTVKKHFNFLFLPVFKSFFLVVPWNGPPSVTVTFAGHTSFMYIAFCS